MADKFSIQPDKKIFSYGSFVDFFQTDDTKGIFSIGTFADYCDRDFILAQAFTIDTSDEDIVSYAEVQTNPFWISSIVVNYVESITKYSLSDIVITEDNIIGVQVIGDISNGSVPLTSYFCANGKVVGADKMVLKTLNGDVELSAPVIDSSSATFSISFNGLSDSSDIYFIVYKKSS